MSHHAQIDPGVPSRLVVASASLTLILCSNAMAQTSVFTYQGALTDAGNPATGMYDMQFKLFDSVDIATGNQVGTTIDRIGVPVTNGRFTVEFDFGPGVFDGSAGPRESEYTGLPALRARQHQADGIVQPAVGCRVISAKPGVLEKSWQTPTRRTFNQWRRRPSQSTGWKC